jgi:hypothetical protein
MLTSTAQAGWAALLHHLKLQFAHLATWGSKFQPDCRFPPLGAYTGQSEDYLQLTSRSAQGVGRGEIGLSEQY